MKKLLLTIGTALIISTSLFSVTGVTIKGEGQSGQATHCTSHNDCNKDGKFGFYCDTNGLCQIAPAVN